LRGCWKDLAWFEARVTTVVGGGREGCWWLIEEVN